MPDHTAREIPVALDDATREHLEAIAAKRSKTTGEIAAALLKKSAATESAKLAPKRRATNARLAPGEDSIDRVTPQKRAGHVVIDWRYRPLDGSQVVDKTSQGKTAGAARRNARRTLEKLRQGGQAWRLDDALLDVIERETRPAIERADITDESRALYLRGLEFLTGGCRQDHRHTHDFRRHTIASGTTYRALADVLAEVAALHGISEARRLRSVIGRYVIQPLMRDGLLPSNPIAGAPLEDLTGTKKPARARGGKALTQTEYRRVLEYLLALDSAAGIVTTPTTEHRRPAMVAKAENARVQALLQATTGLRATEANGIRWSDARDTEGGGLAFAVRKEAAKGSRPRTVLVLDERVTALLRERRANARSDDFVVGSPADAAKPWDTRNRNRAAEDLYTRMHRDLGIETFASERSHMWRTTLHTLLLGSVPPDVLDAQFGNTQAVRAAHYSDPDALAPLSNAAHVLGGS